nr:restriction endonuclease subunit S [Actinocorallia populi]
MGRIVYDSAKRVDRVTYEAWTARAIPQRNDIILAREAPVGEVGLVDGETPICLGQRTVLLRPDRQLVSPRYLHYRLLMPEIQELMRMRSEGSTVAHLNVADIRRLDLGVLPQISVQDAVSQILGSLDDKIIVNDRIREVSSSLLRCYSDVLHWDVSRVRKLSEVIELRYGKALKATDRTPGDVPVFGGNGISGSHDTPLVSGPGIIIGRKGANAGSVSWSQKDFWPIDTAFYVESKGEGLPLEYLFFLLQRVDLRGVVGDSAIPGLNRETALSLGVSLPETDSVTRFVEFVRPMLQRQQAAEEESRSLMELRDALLPKLMSGEIRVKDAERVVEEAV